MIESFNVPLFNQQRKIRVYLPKGYSESLQKYPVLYMHDGQNVFDDSEAIGGVSLNLHKYLDKENVELIVAAIDQNTAGSERLNEYCPWKNGDFSRKVLGYQDTTGGKGKEYIDFIVHELKPLIDAKYRTKQIETYMAGISLGGLVSTYAACRYPTIFNRIAAISSAFYRNQEEIEKLLQTSDLSYLERFYLDCGTSEAGENTKVSELFLASNETIAEKVKSKVAHVNFDIIKHDKHEYIAFKQRVPNFIKYLTS